jgi:3'(2'), 5'-bisphosphate nucleotidase
VAEVFGIADRDRLLDGLTTIATRAAAAILAVPIGALSRRDKPDGSPVTAADLASQQVILEGLKALLPGLPVISEETSDRTKPQPPAQPYVMVDPLDGTRELLAGRDEFTVNIAIISAGKPFLGVVAAPARGLLWRGIVGEGAERMQLSTSGPAQARERQAVRVRTRPADGVVALVSRSHLDPATEAFLARTRLAQTLSCGSSLKFCLIAEGSADLYPRLSPTHEWDVAAGHAVLASAGGSVTTPDGAPLRYGRPDFRIPAFIAWGERQGTP